MTERTYQWTPVPANASPLAEISGLEYFRAIAAGTLPEQPISSTIGWSIDSVEYGVLRLSFDPAPWLLNAAGLLHGGAIATLLDSAMSGAVFSALPQGGGCTTLQMSVTPIRGVRETSGRMIAEGKVTSNGRRIGTATGEIRDAAGKLHAHGSTSCLIF